MNIVWWVNFFVPGAGALPRALNWLIYPDTDFANPPQCVPAGVRKSYTDALTGPAQLFSLYISFKNKDINIFRKVGPFYACLHSVR